MPGSWLLKNNASSAGTKGPLFFWKLIPHRSLTIAEKAETFETFETSETEKKYHFFPAN